MNSLLLFLELMTQPPWDSPEFLSSITALRAFTQKTWCFLESRQIRIDSSVSEIDRWLLRSANLRLSSGIPLTSPICAFCSVRPADFLWSSKSGRLQRRESIDRGRQHPAASTYARSSLPWFRSRVQVHFRAPSRPLCDLRVFSVC